MEYTHGTKDTLAWMQAAKPNPSPKDLTTQLGVHFEEVSELVETLKSTDPAVASYLQDAEVFLKNLAEVLKITNEPIIITNREAMLDSIADQLVTAVGVAHCAAMDAVGALNEVNRSNFSKFDDNGQPLLDINRKVMKGPNYSKPDLTPFV